MAIWADFKKFAFKGNVVDLAVGVVIGAAFTKIVGAIVADFIMPIIALVMPNGDWRKAAITLKHDAIDPAKDVKILWGDFLGAVLDFLIVAFVLFLIVSKIVKKAEQRFSKPAEAPTTQECPFCLEIVPIKATRCKSCTSQLGESAPAA